MIDFRLFNGLLSSSLFLVYSFDRIWFLFYSFFVQCSHTKRVLKCMFSCGRRLKGKAKKVYRFPKSRLFKYGVDSNYERWRSLTQHQERSMPPIYVYQTQTNMPFSSWCRWNATSLWNEMTSTRIGRVNERKRRDKVAPKPHINAHVSYKSIMHDVYIFGEMEEIRCICNPNEVSILYSTLSS